MAGFEMEGVREGTDEVENVSFCLEEIIVDVLHEIMKFCFGPKLPTYRYLSSVEVRRCGG